MSPSLLGVGGTVLAGQAAGGPVVRHRSGTLGGQRVATPRRRAAADAAARAGLSSSASQARAALAALAVLALACVLEGWGLAVFVKSGLVSARLLLPAAARFEWRRWSCCRPSVPASCVCVLLAQMLMHGKHNCDACVQGRAEGGSCGSPDRPALGLRYQDRRCSGRPVWAHESGVCIFVAAGAARTARRPCRQRPASDAPHGSSRRGWRSPAGQLWGPVANCTAGTATDGLFCDGMWLCLLCSRGGLFYGLVRGCVSVCIFGMGCHSTAWLRVAASLKSSQCCCHAHPTSPAPKCIETRRALLTVL